MAAVRLLASLFAACALSGAGGCATFVTYPGAQRPAQEVATLHCYSRYYVVYMESCGFQAVDGFRPGLSQLFTNTSEVLPGAHWIEIAFESYFGGGGGITDVCAFELDFEPNAVYRVKAHSLATEISLLGRHAQRGFYRGWLDVSIARGSGASEVRRVEATCSAFGGSMCRKDADCVDHPEIACIPQEGFPFGQCRFK
jgi:hypothetical protein